MFEICAAYNMCKTIKITAITKIYEVIFKCLSTKISTKMLITSLSVAGFAKTGKILSTV